MWGDGVRGHQTRAMFFFWPETQKWAWRSFWPFSKSITGKICFSRPIFFTFLIPTFLFWFHGHFFENFTGGILIWRARFWNFSRVRCIFSLALFSENHPREDAKFQKSENSPPEENPKSRRGIKPPLRNSVLHMKLKILQSLPRGQLTAWWRHKTFLESYFWRWLDFCFS